MLSNRKLINVVLTYILKNKGKELRPILVLLCAKLNGEINEKTFVSAALVELLHTASLVHDDVVDNSQLRRSVFSIKALWQSKLAVLVGDYLLAKGLLISVKYKSYDSLEVVSEAVQKMAEGELLQIEKARRLNIKEKDYFEIIENKTASLLVASAVSGVKSVTDNPVKIQKMREFALNLGIAFQLKDDLFDYEKTDSIGKPNGNDIQESKMTLPLIYSLNNSDKALKNRVKRILSKKIKTKNNIDFVHNFVSTHGGLEYTKQVLNSYISNSKQILNTYFEDNESRKSLNILVDYVVLRNK
ncbi:MAG: polyprenyl synthetase family protein [Bacteroidales bacterium]|nr:polyprenyl synthetase family protein [Bacteroidales bacterium]